MQTDIEHLPAKKQIELKQLVTIIRQHTDDIEMVILFGSYARGEYKEEKDLKPNRKSGHASDYDVLVVTKNRSTVDNSELWKTINDDCYAQQFSAVPRLIVHDIQQLNIKLAQAHYFYTEVTEEGCFLYNSEQFTLAEKRELLPEEYKRLAQENFDSWHQKANNFYSYYKFGMKKSDFIGASFQLNQATESAYKTILLVFTNNVPHEHYLSLLNNYATSEHESFADIFPLDTKAQRDRFNLLDYAYIGARYDPTFKIGKGDLEPLAECVEKLIKLTKKICEEKIQSFA